MFQKKQFNHQMKRFVTVLLSLLISLTASASAFAGETIRIAALKGPTAIGMVQMMQENNAERSFTVCAAIDEITPRLVKGDIDIAAVPANMASVLYNNTNGKIRVLAINTLGVLYIVENGTSISSVEDLRGRTLYASGKGATPEYALDYILRENGIDPETDLRIEYKSEHSECLAALIANEGAAAMLPQPFVTTAMMKQPAIRVVLDMSEEWDRLQENNDHASAMLTGVVVVRTEYAETHAEEIARFLKDYGNSVSFVNGHTDEAAEMVGALDIIPETVARLAIPFCNIVCITGEEMQSKLSGYLQVLYEQNPSAVGGRLPDEAFYYLSQAE